jgi:hypothetical protein
MSPPGRKARSVMSKSLVRLTKTSRAGPWPMRKPRMSPASFSAALRQRQQRAGERRGARQHAERLDAAVGRQAARAHRHRARHAAGEHALPAERVEAEDAVGALDADPGRATLDPQALRVPVAGLGQRPAAGAENGRHARLRQAGEPPALQVDAGGEPLALVGDRGEALARRIRAQRGQAAEAPIVGLQLQAAAEGEGAELLLLRLARHEGVDREGTDLDVDRRARHRAAGLGAVGQRWAPRGRRREPGPRGASGTGHQATRRRGAGAARGAFGGMLVEELGELLGHGAAEFLGVHDGHGAAVVARHVVADADGDELHRRAGLDLLDDPAQVPLQVVARVHRQGGIVHRRAVGDHHQDLALLGAGEQALVRPVQRLAVDVLLEEPSRIIRPRFLRARRQGASAAL